MHEANQSGPDAVAIVVAGVLVGLTWTRGKSIEGGKEEADYIAPISRLYLAYISSMSCAVIAYPISCLYLAYISPMSCARSLHILYLAYIAPMSRG